MKNIKYVIIEDEKNSAELLEGMLERYFTGIEKAGVAATAEDGAALIRHTSPDLVFLDIEMPDASGFDLLDRVKDAECGIIFVTGYDQYAIKAIKYSALDYLLKPVNLAELQQAVARYSSRHRTTPGNIEVLRERLEDSLPARIVIHGRKGYQLLNLEDILAIVSDGGYALFYMVQGHKHLASHTLSYYEELLPAHFFRLHKSSIINLLHVREYEQGRGGIARMADGSGFEIAARRKPEFIARIQNLKR